MPGKQSRNGSVLPVERLIEGVNLMSHSVPPANWLQSGPNGIRDPAKVLEILASFANPPILTRLLGPEILLRAVGQDETGKPANPYRGFWVRQSTLLQIYGNLGQFEGWLTAQELSAMAEWRYRAFTAVCINWNDFSEFAELWLPAGEGISCLIGDVAPQPLHSASSLRASTTPILQGGAEQIFFRGGGDSNPLWVRLRPKADIF
jgi:hypothetical protein